MIDKDTASFLGYMIGNGWIEKSTGRVCVTVSSAEHMLAQELHRLFAHVFQGETSSKYHVPQIKTYAWSQRPHAIPMHRMTSQSPYVRNLLNTYAVLDDGARSKSFTQQFFALPVERQIDTLRGLYTADGTASGRGGPEFTTVSETLYDQVKGLLALAGIIPSGYIQYRLNGRKAYRIFCYGYDRVLFHDRVGFLPQSHKQEQLRKHIIDHPPRKRKINGTEPITFKHDQSGMEGAADEYGISLPSRGVAVPIATSVD